ncbi:hypothetical protein J4429_01110 [Candidatus Pacearchaeota archaeon]|nr:hypothetical protein [Candidatus Pacearchaeota archaeon]
MSKKFVICLSLIGILFFINLVNAAEFDVEIELNNFYYGDEIEGLVEITGDISDIDYISYQWNVWYTERDEPHIFYCHPEGDDQCDYISDNKLKHTFKINSTYFTDLGDEIFGRVKIFTKSRKELLFLGDSRTLSSRPLKIVELTLDDNSYKHGATINLTSDNFQRYGYVGSLIKKKSVHLQCCEGPYCSPEDNDFCSVSSFDNDNLSCSGTAWGYLGKQMIACNLRDYSGYSETKEIWFDIVEGKIPSTTNEEISREGVRYEKDLLKALEDKDFAKNLMKDEDFIGLEIIDGKVWANVFIRLRDKSNIEDNYEENNLSGDEWFSLKSDEILSSLSNDEFLFVDKLSNGFSGKISLDGFLKLRKNDDITLISWPKWRLKLLDGSGPLVRNDSYYLAYTISIIFIIGFLILMIFLLKSKKKRHKKK